MRYCINFAKTINQLVPYYLGGRKLILYLQALLAPLQKLNDEFVNYAKETRIDATMTSQIIKFEWYLNRKFSRYFVNNGRISIKTSDVLGIPIYRESAEISDVENVILYKESESDIKGQLILYHDDEQTSESSVSFIVSTPMINTQLIKEEEYVAMLKNIINKYRLANKTYIIKYE